jgi:release factor glutamine methyltransferase
MKWTIKELIKTSTDFLRKKKIDEPRLTTEILLAHTLGMKRVSLYLNFDKPIHDNERSVFREYVKRRVANEPVQYITGKTGFIGLEIETDEGVFIPRQETEILVSEVKKLLEEKGKQDFVLYDIGTGTGAIAISLAKFFNNSKIYASDISEEALECARKNIATYSFEERITLFSGALFEPFREIDPADVIVSNPPYVPEDEIEKLPEVVKKEPHEALDGGVEGLEIIKRIVTEARNFLVSGGILAFEIGINQSESVEKLIRQEKAYKDTRIIPDFRGIKRVVTTQKS